MAKQQLNLGIDKKSCKPDQKISGIINGNKRKIYLFRI